MFTLSKLNISKQINFASKCFQLIPKVAGERTNFAPTFYGMDKFTRHTEYVTQRHSSDLDSIRNAVKLSVEKPEAKAFTEDIKTFLYLTKTDSDFELLKKAIEKYEKQSASPIFNFRFASPLMRLAYTLNKTNEMLELYLQEQPNYLHSTISPGFILMNKLFEERRYDDVLLVFNRMVRTLETRETTGDFFPFDALRLAIEANLEKNDDDSLKNAAQLLKTIKNFNWAKRNPSQMVTCLFITVLQRENVELLNEIYEFNKSLNKSPVITSNLRIITLCINGKVREALDSFAEDFKLIQVNPETDAYGRRRSTSVFYFDQTLDILKNGVKRLNNNEDKKLLDEIISRIKSNNLMSRSDLKEYATRRIDYTQADREKLRANQGNDSFKTRNRFSDQRRPAKPQPGESSVERQPENAAPPESSKPRNKQSALRGSEQTKSNPAEVHDDEVHADAPTERQTNSPKSRRQYLE